MPGVSIDHLVGTQQKFPANCQSESVRRFEIDDELEFGGLLNRQVGGLRALQNPVHISSGWPAGFLAPT